MYKQKPDRTISNTVYRNTTHTNQYLHWGSHYKHIAIYSVFNTHSHRTRTVCSNPQLLQKEEDLNKVLKPFRFTENLYLSKWPFLQWHNIPSNAYMLSCSSGLENRSTLQDKKYALGYILTIS